MLTVACVRWGAKYSADYVLELRDMVARHLPIAHRFVCVTAEPIAGVECIEPVCEWAGWWQKVGLFSFAWGPTIYLDLDVRVIGSIAWLAEYSSCDLAAIEDWGARTREGPRYADELQSSVMAWDSGNANARRIYDEFSPAVIRRLHPHGDQTYITEISREFVTRMPQERVVSYKRHCRGRPAPPAGASIVVFHGEPKPHAATEPWLRDLSGV